VKRVLYISYDGLLDPLGCSQVQPYLRELGNSGVELWALSFEKPEKLKAANEVKKLRAGLSSCGVEWRPLRYHKRPAMAATAWDVIRGVLTGLRLMICHRIGIIHARSYIAALVGLILCSIPGTRFLFDMRGFWADERVEGGLWPAGGRLYRLFKRLEGLLLNRADAVVVLSRRGANVVEQWLSGRNPRPPVAVIPTCADLELFRPSGSPRKLSSSGGLRLVYLGSLGTWYLIDEMLAFYVCLWSRFPESSFRVLTPSDPVELEKAMTRVSFPAEAVERVKVGNLPYGKVPGALQEADCSIFFIKPSFSKQASCATKFAESLACGLPVLINAGVGDHDRQVKETGVGVVLNQLDSRHYDRGVDELMTLLKDSTLATRCRETACREFSLEVAVRTYRELYQGMFQSPTEQR
jgi:glycosyltransferase involved in cell wall biosynthesis